MFRILMLKFQMDPLFARLQDIKNGIAGPRNARGQGRTTDSRLPKAMSPESSSFSAGSIKPKPPWSRELISCLSLYFVFPLQA